jgi:hypothetical protein
MSSIDIVLDQLREQGITHVRLGTLLNLFATSPDDLSAYTRSHLGELKMMIGSASSTP